MNEFIKIELEFNEKLERKGQQFFFQYVWKKSFSKLKKTIFLGLLFLGIGFLPLEEFDTSPIPYIFKYIGFLYVGFFLLLIIQYFKSKKKTYRLIEEQIDDFIQKDREPNSISLDKNNITIENPFNTIRSIWDKTSYQFVDEYLILNILNDRLCFIFTEAEFKENDYQVLKDFIQQYSQKKVEQ
ncbi:hypothetical protein MP478_20440 [Chryseobacterium sp. WG14]|uniref:hypothetical protein n=1 Tax=Chryseobacterium sp. WG14 TaxID=2926909 RepID=UPI00211E28B8|nr:hypothetical protein [Chryseobacterium sp. WG14]MCQ9641757.1 hypothetical protein [Chryseobacterium sp. WG14]